MLRAVTVIASLALLAGCVTHYYPAPVAEDGVYYAGDDWRHAEPSVPVDYGYYPWWSLDYFYLGSGYHGSTLSIGIGYPYRPWYGWYGYHYPYYYPPYYYGWYSPVWHHRHHYFPSHRYYAYRGYEWKRHFDRVSSPAREPQDFRRDRVHDRVPRDYEDRYTSRERNPGTRVPRATNLPVDDSGNRMRVRRYGDSKEGPSRTHPAGSPTAIGTEERAADAPIRVISDSRRYESVRTIPFGGDSGPGTSRSEPVFIDRGRVVGAPAESGRDAPGNSARFVPASRADSPAWSAPSRESGTVSRPPSGFGGYGDARRVTPAPSLGTSGHKPSISAPRSRPERASGSVRFKPRDDDSDR